MMQTLSIQHDCQTVSTQCPAPAGHKIISMVILVTAQAGGLRHRRRRGGEVWGGGVPLPTVGGVYGGGCAPSSEFFLDF